MICQAAGPMRAWMIVKILGLSIVQQPTARPGAPRLGW
eukprot:COSAG01_NODE_16100_length_1270_cov_1.529462_1_plen_37_part_10